MANRTPHLRQPPTTPTTWPEVAKFALDRFFQQNAIVKGLTLLVLLSIVILLIIVILNYPAILVLLFPKKEGH